MGFVVGLILGALAYPAGLLLAHLIHGTSPIYPKEP